MHADWNQALDAQTDLISFWRSHAGARYASAFADSIGRKLLQDAKTGEMMEGDEADVQNTRSTLLAAIHGLYGADPIWVEGEVCELVQAAAETFKPEAIYKDDLFVDHGFAVFEKPVYCHDINGKRIANRAVAWNIVQVGENPGKEELVVSLYTHRLDDDDFSTSYKDAPDGLFPKLGASDLGLNHFSLIFFGNTAWLSIPSQAELSKLLQVFWRMAKQEIAIPGRMPAARATWRRAKWREIKHISVYTLRRLRSRSQEPDEEREVPWSHRWMVNGHWRNQPYKIDGKMVHRQIWIAPYVKGPDDKPLVIKKRVYDFRR